MADSIPAGRAVGTGWTCIGSCDFTISINTDYSMPMLQSRKPLLRPRSRPLFNQKQLKSHDIRSIKWHWHCVTKFSRQMNCHMVLKTACLAQAIDVDHGWGQVWFGVELSLIMRVIFYERDKVNCLLVYSYAWEWLLRNSLNCLALVSLSVVCLFDCLLLYVTVFCLFVYSFCVYLSVCLMFIFVYLSISVVSV